MRNCHENVVTRKYFQEVFVVSEMRFAAFDDEKQKQQVETHAQHCINTTIIGKFIWKYLTYVTDFDEIHRNEVGMTGQQMMGEYTS